MGSDGDGAKPSLWKFAERIRKKQKGAERSRKKQKEAERSRKEQKEAERSRKKQKEAERSKSEFLNIRTHPKPRKYARHLAKESKPSARGQRSGKVI